MSAPNPGRQSPSPERQTGAQQRDPISQGKAQHKYPPPEHSTQGQGLSQEEQTAGLSSNPKHPLEDIEAAKFTKGSVSSAFTEVLHEQKS
ncbi:hypothetical protein BO70DRAFT_398935 [Aspergillus heteromorphus CBS 117.55]|uniref:Uncharacterized protein n=1 Tax=Aspergillus heteromorphus CBS 117.55 TaxID=1448321 RepID=A0A317VHD0_9EURO|nr:uncharacterized protein BO70DRAFT_398935 [Aspergillus heteromorphus CBS 117.55]PWY73713.1 hypothetical protein BO70DRAFT_398935 [Aspergillus heteromorphus CBS 117.55]